MICETLQSKEFPVGSPGAEQPHVVEDTPQDCVKKSLATYAMQTSGTRKLEEASGKATPWTNLNAEAEAVLAENRAVGTVARLNAEAKMTMGHLDAEEAKDRPGAEEKAIREEVARAKEKAARNAAAEAEKVQAEVEAKAKCEADLKAKAEAASEARALSAEAEWKAGEEQEESCEEGCQGGEKCCHEGERIERQAGNASLP
jgi:hypothetical protein